MKALFTKPLLPYNTGIVLVLAITWFIFSQLMENTILIGAIIIAEYIILLIMMLHVYEKYIKPINKTTKTVGELAKGNYGARVHDAAIGSIGELNNKINILARTFSEFEIQEKIKEKQLSTVIDNTQSGLVLIDEKGYIHLVNRKFLSMFGGTVQDYRGRLYYEVLDNEIIHQTVQDTFLYEENVANSFTHIKSVDKRYIDIVGAPIFNERKMLKGSVLVLYDITHLKKLELMRKDFVANVSHELKTPITSIKGFAETLLDGAMNDKETLENFLKIINDESARLQGLIEDLLRLSNLEKDDFKLNRSKIHVDQLVRGILPIINQRAEAEKISLSVDVPEHIELQADEDLVKQVVINLLTNAISYTPENGEVTLSVDECDHNVHIQVSDTGIGMNQEEIPRVFERFYRVDKARSRNTGGTGLGLAIVKHIIEVHNGKTSVDSSPGEGSTFHVYFPKE